MLGKRISEIPLELIYINPKQPRKIFGEEDLAELRDSIKEYGVLQPVIVKKDRNGRYLLIAGERRLRASAMAGLSRIPAVLKNADERDTAIIALVENVQRENLNYIEEAYAYKNLMEEHGLTQTEISKRVGKKQSTISNKLRLLNLPEELREVLYKNKLTERHARALLKVEDNLLRKQILDKIVVHELNVKQSEKLVEDMLQKEQECRRLRNKIGFINHQIYISTLRRAFGEIFAAEKGAKFYQDEKDEFVEIRITIPKKNKRAQ